MRAPTTFRQNTGKRCRNDQLKEQAPASMRPAARSEKRKALIPDREWQYELTIFLHKVNDVVLCISITGQTNCWMTLPVDWLLRLSSLVAQQVVTCFNT